MINLVSECTDKLTSPENMNCMGNVHCIHIHSEDSYEEKFYCINLSNFLLFYDMISFLHTSIHHWHF